jgi:hypothetical protein
VASTHQAPNARKPWSPRAMKSRQIRDYTHNSCLTENLRSPLDTNLALYYCILLQTFTQSIAGSFYSSCVHTIPLISFLMRASIKHNIEMTRPSSAFASRVGDTLCCQSCLQICLCIPDSIVYSWKAHFGITLIGRWFSCSADSKAEAQRDRKSFMNQSIHDHPSFLD